MKEGDVVNVKSECSFFWDYNAIVISVSVSHCKVLIKSLNYDKPYEVLISNVIKLDDEEAAIVILNNLGVSVL